MSLFLTFIILFGSVALKETYPEYENPIIVKPHELKGSQTKTAVDADTMNKYLKTGDMTLEQEWLRNDITRHFSLENVEKWADKLASTNMSDLDQSTEAGNLASIRNISVMMQEQIHKTCTQIAETLKMIHFKLAEIKVIEKKMKQIAPVSPTDNLSETHKKLLAQENKLKAAMKKEKDAVNGLMKELSGNQDKLIEAVSVYGKKFAKKNKIKIKNLLTAIDTILRQDMSKKWFKKAYNKFIKKVLAEVKTFSEKQFKNSQKLAKEMKDKYWKNICKKFKNKEENKEAKKEAKKLNKKVKKIEKTQKKKKEENLMKKAPKTKKLVKAKISMKLPKKVAIKKQKKAEKKAENKAIKKLENKIKKNKNKKKVKK
jgi:hypothetical protein